MMRTLTRNGLILVFLALLPWTAASAAIVIDHTSTDLTAHTQAQYQAAKDLLHIAYGHTSHGSQVTSGMSGMVNFINNGGLGMSMPQNFFAWNNGGIGGALDLHDNFKGGDLGNPDYTTWALRTRDYLDDPANADVNVIMWSWCGQANTSEANINTYLSTMNQLELDFPHVTFVYMTGHLVGSGLDGNLHLRNEQIRDYVLANNKVLYDFADIESYDPDGLVNYNELMAHDTCWYDSDGNGSDDSNWALDWQGSHEEGVDWYSVSAAHSQALNGNQKAYAAWALWADIAEMRASAVPAPGSILLMGSGLVGLFMVRRRR